MIVVQIAVLSLLSLMGLAVVALWFFTYYTARRVQAALPPQGSFIDVAGARLHVVDQGKGPAVLLIHGLAGQLRHYTYGVAERLADQFRVIAIDRPGSGYSVRGEETPADLSTQAAAVAELMDKLHLDQVFVVGHSLGGALALTLALEHPRRVAGLALVAPLTHLPDGDKPPAAFKGLMIASPVLRKLCAWTVATPASIAGRDAILGQVFGPEPVPADFATRGGGLLGLRPSQFIAASRDLQAVPSSMPAIVDRYRELRVPVSILYGRDDRILDWKRNGQGLADKLPGARLQLVDGGHMLPVTRPELTAQFIRDAVLQEQEA